MAIPEFEQPTDELRQQVKEWKESHEMTYARVWDQLDRMRQTWQLMSRAGRRGVLQGSYVFTVFTQQTDTHLAEEAWRRLLAGEDIRTARIKAKAYKQRQIAAWVYDSFADVSTWDEALDLIDNGSVDLAHKLLIDQATGLKAAKAGFVLANLGLTQKMCIDGNLANLLGGDAPDTVVVDKYESVCADIRDFFPDVAANLEPYHVQWLLFDFQRFHRFGRGEATGKVADADNMRVATHEVWFGDAIGNHRRVTQRMNDLTDTALRAHDELAASEYEWESLTRMLQKESGEDFDAFLDRVEMGQRTGVDNVSRFSEQMADIDSDIVRAQEEAIGRDIERSLEGL